MKIKHEYMSRKHKGVCVKESDDLVVDFFSLPPFLFLLPASLPDPYSTGKLVESAATSRIIWTVRRWAMLREGGRERGREGGPKGRYVRVTFFSFMKTKAERGKREGVARQLSMRGEGGRAGGRKGRREEGKVTFPARRWR